MTDPKPSDAPEDDASRYFVTVFDPSGVMMTARKFREHLTLAEAKAMQAEATKEGSFLLIYKEHPPATPGL